MPADTPQDLKDFRVLWESYLLAPTTEMQDQLLIQLDAIREDCGLSDAEWDRYTFTLEGFDEWWERVRLEYLKGASEGLDG